MENTLENKQKFFAQYWGQEVQSYRLSRHSPRKINQKVKDFAHGHL